MEIQRDEYLKKLVSSIGNGMIKIVTGVRRCGKSYLLFTLFRNWLLRNGTSADHILSVDLDNRMNKDMRDPDKLLQHFQSKVVDNRKYFILIDEVQLLPEFEDVLNSFLHIPNVDVYVTGSNSRFLSTDIATEFRGRGWEIRLFPLSFKEYMSAYPGDRYQGWQDYLTYGGMPQILQQQNDSEKRQFLKSLYKTIYLADIIERHHLRGKIEIEELAEVLASSLGSLCNPNKIADTFKSVKRQELSPATISSWLQHFEDAFLIEKSKRYDVKGKRYISTLSKYYFVDNGIRNAMLDFRQNDPGHQMENVLYYELRRRNYRVDVGLVERREVLSDGTTHRRQLEVDFVADASPELLYVQSSYDMQDAEKTQQEIASLRLIGNSFRKMVVIGQPVSPHYDNNGIFYTSIFDFLLNDVH